MKRYAIIVAGGSGKRMGLELPKQFLELKGQPVLMHTLKRFQECGPAELILVLNIHYHDYWEELCRKHAFKLPHQLVSGGVTRFDSVKRGLKAVTRKGIIAVHDAVRPLVSPRLIQACFEQAEKKGNAVPALPSRESLRKGSMSRSQSLSRADYHLVQTPQCFESSLLKRAYRQEFRNEFTDDASVVERTGTAIHLIAGDPNNLKITYPDDLKIAAALLEGTGRSN